jgi:hypothetical protein
VLTDGGSIPPASTIYKRVFQTSLDHYSPLTTGLVAFYLIPPMWSLMVLIGLQQVTIWSHLTILPSHPRHMLIMMIGCFRMQKTSLMPKIKQNHTGLINVGNLGKRSLNLILNIVCR